MTTDPHDSINLSVCVLSSVQECAPVYVRMGCVCVCVSLCIVQSSSSEVTDTDISLQVSTGMSVKLFFWIEVIRIFSLLCLDEGFKEKSPQS